MSEQLLLNYKTDNELAENKLKTNNQKCKVISATVAFFDKQNKIAISDNGQGLESMRPGVTKKKFT